MKQLGLFVVTFCEVCGFFGRVVCLSLGPCPLRSVGVFGRRFPAHSLGVRVTLQRYFPTGLRLLKFFNRGSVKKWFLVYSVFLAQVARSR